MGCVVCNIAMLKFFVYSNVGIFEFKKMTFSALKTRTVAGIRGRFLSHLLDVPGVPAERDGIGLLPIQEDLACGEEGVDARRRPACPPGLADPPPPLSPCHSSEGEGADRGPRRTQTRLAGPSNTHTPGLADLPSLPSSCHESRLAATDG